MRLIHMKSVFILIAKFLAIESLVLFAMLLSLFTITVASQAILTGNDAPVKVQQHPSTFFDKTKPVFNQYENYGIHLVLPIGLALTHAEQAVAFAGAIPKAKINYAHVAATSKISNNNISTESVTVPPSTFWSA